jgi:hypothetical protein
MTVGDVWPLVHAERAALVHDRARFDFDEQNARGIEKWRGVIPEETLRRLRAAASRTTPTWPSVRDRRCGVLRCPSS